MVLYISGLNSTYKPFVKNIIDEEFNCNSIYYVIEGNLSLDMYYLKSMIKDQAEVFVIGHSTGGFYALNLFRLFDNIVSVNLINPAIDLKWSIEKNNPPNNFQLSEVSNNIKANSDFFKNKVFPVYCYQGLDDDRVNIEYNKKFINSCAGQIDLIGGVGHRFNEEEFKNIVNRIYLNFFPPD